MRRSRKSASTGASSRLLLHLGPGLRQAIDSDDVYYVEAAADDTEVRTRGVRLVRRRARGEDWELTLAAPVNVVLPVSRSALAALWTALGEP